MTDKTMPERMAILRSDEDECFCVAPLMLLGNQKVCEYIRADLVSAPSADDPLADGQYRWVHVEGEWHVAFVWKKIMSDGFAFELGKFDYWEEDIKKIGPVVRPPANNAN